jgi:hypothetical protein
MRMGETIPRGIWHGVGVSAHYEDDEVVIHVDYSWSNGARIGVAGWVLPRAGRLVRAAVGEGDLVADVTAWEARPDVSDLYGRPEDARCGFAIEVPAAGTRELVFEVESDHGTARRTVRVDHAVPETPLHDTSTPLYDAFVAEVNDRRLDVLEIGSRVVSPGSSTKRGLFPGAASYTGFDYYPDDNTDVVGDAHRLSRHLEGRTFGAVFSLSVLEHLAMPWVVAAEINRVLAPGGLTFHHTPQAWPLHDQPWDFWRFSTDALQVLFSPALGFDVLGVGYNGPLRMHFDDPDPGQERFSLHIAYGGAAILARKTTDVDRTRFAWDVALDELLGPESHYPAPAS